MRTARKPKTAPKPQKTKEELSSIEDSFTDTANYGMIGLLLEIMV